MADLLRQLDNPAVWLILITAVVAYGLLFDLWLDRNSSGDVKRRFRQWAPGIRTLLGALPLLGLYGTVVGLMQTFRQMAAELGFNPETLATGGIAAAMYTTQLGLMLVIPGWVMLAAIGSSINKQEQNQ
ncbi:MAG: MotA/TolQ/ExbB proton channel family protein [Pseudomonadota bacterium]